MESPFGSSVELETPIAVSGAPEDSESLLWSAVNAVNFLSIIIVLLAVEVFERLFIL